MSDNPAIHGLMQCNSSDSHRVKALWCVLGFAVLIRLLGIGYGLPFVYWTDEYHEVMRAMELGSGEFNLARTGKGGFYLLLFLEYGVYFVTLKLAGIVSTAQEFAQQFVRDPTVFYLLGRATAALFGSANVAAAYFLARLAYGSRAALLAAIFVAVNVLHVELSHRVGVDVPMALFATTALYFGLQVAMHGRRRDYLLAGLCAGLATTTKLPGVLVLAPLLIAHGYSTIRTSRNAMRWFTSGNLWLAAALFAAVLAATNPGILFKTDWLSLYTASPAESTLGDDAGSEDAFDGSATPNLGVFYLKAVLGSMGWPLFILSLFSVGYAAWKRRPSDVMLVSYATLNFLAITNTTSEVLYYPRYALPIILVLCVLASRVVGEAVEFVPRQRAAVLTVVAVILCCLPFAQSVKNTYALTLTDTRTIAKSWIDSHIPVGSKVLIEGGKIAASRLTVPLADSRSSLDRRIAYWKAEEPRQAEFLRLKRAVHEGRGYELELTQVGSVAPLDEYIARHVEFFVVRPETFLGARKSNGRGARFLRELRSDARVELLKRFEPTSTAQLGPTIEIYRLRSNSAPGG